MRFWFLVCLAMLLFLNSQAQDDTLRVITATSKRKNLLKASIVPAVLMSTALVNYGNSGFYSSVDVRNDLRRNFPNFHTTLDDYLQFAPIALVYGLDIVGVKAQHDWINRTIVLAKAELLANGITQTLKYTVREQRPSGTAKESFPSGHTTQAFVSATFMHHEFGKQSVWYSILAYSMATSTGAMRMLNDRHWLSDVLAGAAIGIFSTELIYHTHQYRWGTKEMVVFPVVYKNMLGLSLQTNF